MPGAAGSGGMETSTETALENPLKKLSIHGGKLGGAARKAGRISRPENRKTLIFLHLPLNSLSLHESG